jgi:copper chaperone CopZ
MRSFLRREAGVQEVNVSCETGSARVECDEAVTSPDKVVSAPVFRGSFDAAVGE